MNPTSSTPAADADEEISTLIETLAATEQRLEELTAGEVDTVASRDGRAFLLRRAQEEFRHSAAVKQAVALNELRVLLDLIPAMVWFKDTENKILKINQRAADEIGKSTGELEGKSMLDIYPDDAAKYYADDQEVMRSKEPKLKIIETIRNRAGEVCWIQTDKVPVCDKVGKVVGIVVMSRDITESTLAEEKLRLLNLAVLQAKDSILITDARLDLPGPEIVFVNPAFTEMTGYTEAEAIGQTPRILQGPRTDKAMLKRLRNKLAAGGTFAGEAIQYRKNGQEYLQAWQISPLRNSAGTITHFVAIQRDITEQQRAQDNAKRLAAIVESSADAIISMTLDGIITSWNPAAEKMFGYAAAEIIGQPLLVLLPADRTNEGVETLASFDRGELVRHFETVRLRKGGQSFEVSATISPIKDANGKIIGASKIVRDITEVKKLEQQFRQAQKMESFGQLAGGVAHDFNNILAVIQMQIDLFKDDSRLSPEQWEAANQIGMSAQRAAALTRQLLLFSRKEILRLRELDLNQSINGMSIMLRRILGEDIEVQFKFSLQPLGIKGDAGMMDQVLMNLAVNSRDAMPNGGQLIIETSAVSFDQSTNAPSAQGRPGTFVCLSVGDNGCGIPPENLSRLFEPFFTTKEVGKGTGLGLATVFGIVQQHKGWVNVESEVGKGTTFRIYLPRLARISPAPQALEQPKLSALTGGTETILLVEDDDSLRSTVCNTLSRLGYHVIPVSNGLKAVEIWEARHDDIQLLITDLVMPGGMSGKDLGELLLKQKPDLKVIYASGYSAEIAGTDFPLQEGVNFLVKPFYAQKLAKTIRERFDKPAG